MNVLTLLLGLASIVLGSVDTAKPTIVLVHGAFADGSSWARVIPLLENDGYTVIAVQNPLTSLGDDVATTKRVIEAQKGPIGHDRRRFLTTAAMTLAAAQARHVNWRVAPRRGSLLSSSDDPSESLAIQNYRYGWWIP